MPRENEKEQPPLDHSCRHCKRPNNSRQARYSHEKICQENPANKVKTPDEKRAKIDVNKSIYEEETGVKIPSNNLTEIDEDLMEITANDNETSKGIDPLFLILGFILLLFAAALIFRDKIMNFYKQHTQGATL